MLLRLPLEILIILLPILIFSLCFHEFSHAFIAYMNGDNTAYHKGRLTLNPLSHLDPIGTLMILFVGFGWAKPVPVNPVNFANQRIDMIKVAFAGPASNILLAFIGGSTLRLLSLTGILQNQIIFQSLYYFIYINIALAVFNMIPIPPLDGSQIFSGLMIRKNPDLVVKLQIYGPQILMGLILFGMFTSISPIWLLMSPFVNFFMLLFVGI